MLALLAGAGCGAVGSTAGIVRAEAELTAARTAQAEAHAPFETAAAETYLDKAREEQAYADLVKAKVFAEKAWACARVARLLAEARNTSSEDDVRPEHFAAEAVCRPGPAREVPLAHLEEAALGGARPSASRRAGAEDEPTDPTITPTTPETTKAPRVEAPPPVEAPPSAGSSSGDAAAEPAPPLPAGDPADPDAENPPPEANDPLPRGSPEAGAPPPEDSPDAGDPLPEADEEELPLPEGDPWPEGDLPEGDPAPEDELFEEAREP